MAPRHIPTMSDAELSNYVCTNCRAQLLIKRRREPRRHREEAFCPYCTINLPPRGGKDTLQYTLVAPPRATLAKK
jgi:predicted SprT family Zn-dependent metalloprotease